MKSANLVQIGKIVIDEHCPEPKLTSPEQTLVRVRYAAINADDYSAFARYLGRVYNSQRLLHEFSGEIEDLGELAYHAGFRIGDAVSGSAWLFCGACRNCRSGLEAHCRNAACISVLAEHVVLNMRQIQKLRPGVPLEHGIFTDAIGYCLYNGLKDRGIAVDAHVMIFGCNTFSLILLQLIKLFSGATVSIADKDERKLELARTLGADHAFSPK